MERTTEAVEIGRNKERESWNGQVERLETEKRTVRLHLNKIK